MSTVRDKDMSLTWSGSKTAIMESGSSRLLQRAQLQRVKLVGFGVETMGQDKCQSGTVGPERPHSPSGRKSLPKEVMFAERQGGQWPEGGGRSGRTGQVYV